MVDEVGPDCEKEGLRQRKGDNLNTDEEKSGITVEEKNIEKKQVSKTFMGTQRAHLLSWKSHASSPVRSAGPVVRSRRRSRGFTPEEASVQ